MHTVVEATGWLLLALVAVVIGLIGYPIRKLIELRQSLMYDPWEELER